MIKNNKGFAITEVLIISTVVIGVLIFMYTQFKNINRSYQYSFKYDTVEGMYLANNIVNYVSDNLYDQLVEALNNSEVGYLDITECDTSQIATSTFCVSLFEKSKVERVLFTEENLKQTKATMTDLTEDIQDYINQIQINDIQNDHRIIIKYKDKTFATMRFNRGESYVQNGLIVHLDAINNTGKGHSNDIKEWADLSGNGNSATLYNNPSWSNNSLTFDGLTNYARLENTTGMEFTNGVTLEARVKVLSFIGINGDGDIAFFGNWESAGMGLLFSNKNTYHGNFYLNNQWKDVITNNSSNMLQYYTVTVTYNDASSSKLYIDGQLMDTFSFDEGTIKKSLAPLALGGNPKVNGMNSYANVEFQSVRVYNRALTDDEVLRNYQIDMARY